MNMNDRSTSAASGGPLCGVLPVLHTPLHPDQSIDWQTLQQEIDWALGVGADGVVVAMVSEILRLSETQRRELGHFVCQAVRGRSHVVISVGAESTAAAIEHAAAAEAAGATAVMAIPPVATRLSSAALEDYFAQIAAAVSLPLVVQDASGYVGAAIDLGVYLNLLDRFGPERILFKPEASPLGPNLSRLRDASGGTAKIFEGSGGINLVDCYRRGIHGTMPGTDLLDAIVALWQALQAGDDDRIYELAFPISAIVSLQLSAGLDGFLAIEKHLMHRRGLFPHVQQRLPVAWELDNETRQEVDRLFDRLRITLARSVSEGHGTAASS